VHEILTPGAPLDILFASEKLELLCHDDRLATRTLGAPSARKLRARLDDLISSANLDYARNLPGRFHALTGDRAGQYAVDLQAGRRLVVAPANDPLLSRPDGSLDLTKVTIISVIYVGDYHD